MTKNPNEMNPEELVRWFANELNRGQSIVIPIKMLDDTLKALELWLGIKSSELDVRNAKLKKSGQDIKQKHCTLTLKKYVKT